MSGSGTLSGGPEGLVQPGQNQRNCHRKSWRMFGPEPASEGPMGWYQWTTCAEGGDQNLEHSQLFGLMRYKTLPRPQNQVLESPNGPGSLRTFLRSLSEPGSTAGADGPKKVKLRKAGSNTERRAPSVNFICSLSRRISRVLRDQPNPEPESGRRVQLLHGLLIVCCCLFLFLSSFKNVPEIKKFLTSKQQKHNCPKTVSHD